MNKSFSLLIVFVFSTAISVAQNQSAMNITVQKGHTDIIRFASFANKSNTLVTASKDGTIKLWDITHGGLIRTIIPVYNNKTNWKFSCLAISPDGERIASGTENTLSIWSANGHLISQKEVFDYNIAYLSFTADNSSLIAVSLGSQNVKSFDKNGVLIENWINKETKMGVTELAMAFPDKNITMLTRTGGLITSKNEYYIYILSPKKEIVKKQKIDIEGLYPLGFSSSPDKDYYIVQVNNSAKPSKFEIWNTITNTVTSSEAFPPNSFFLSNTKAIVGCKGSDVVIYNLDGVIRNTISVSGAVDKAWDMPDGNFLISIIDSSKSKEDKFQLSIYRPDGTLIQNLGQSISNLGHLSSSLNDKVIAFTGNRFGYTMNFERMQFQNYKEFANWESLDALVLSNKREFTETDPYLFSVVLCDPTKENSKNRDKQFGQFAIAINNKGAVVNNQLMNGFLFGSLYRSSPDGLYSVLIDGSMIYFFDSKGTPIKKYNGKKTGLGLEEVNYCTSFSKDGKLCLTLSNKGIILWNSKGGIERIIQSEAIDPKSKFSINSAALSPDGEKIFAQWYDEFILFDSKGKILSRKPLPSELTANIEKLGEHDQSLLMANSLTKSLYSPDGEFIVGITSDTIISFVKPDGSFVKAFYGHNGAIKDLNFSHDGSLIISSSEDNTIRFWNVKSGEHAALIVNDKDWIIYTPDGYFDASKNGVKLAGMNLGRSVFSVELFTAKYNRPDIILKRLGLGTPELLSHFEAKHNALLGKLGFIEEQLSTDINIPTTIIKTKETKDKSTTITATLFDDKYNLKSYNIFVNDVPLYGSFGKEISGMKSEITEKIELTYGSNKIEVSCINEKGAESYRASIYANYNTKTKRDVYLLAIGVSRYKNQKSNLLYADKDAYDLSRVIEGYKRNGFENIYTKLLTNDEVTAETIKTSKDFVKNAKPDDAFILYVGGQGIYEKNAEAKYYFITSHTDINNLLSTAIDFELIEDLLVDITPRNKLFLRDICESSEINEMNYSNMMATAAGIGISSRGLKTTEVRSGNRSYLHQKDRFIYNRIIGRSGAFVLSASKEGELSFESEEIQNGLFIKSVINALSSTETDKNINGIISILELHEFVSAEVAKASGDLQHPTLEVDNSFQKFGFQVW